MSSVLEKIRIWFCYFSLHICNTVGVRFLAFMTMITIYCYICVFWRKNNLRIFRGSKWQKIKNIEAQKKIKYSCKIKECRALWVDRYVVPFILKFL